MTSTSSPPYRMAHLTRSQRDKLEALLRSEHRHTQTEMAEIVGCNQATVSRELKRNSSLVQNRYTANTTQKRSENRRRIALALQARWYDNPVLYVEVIFELFDGKSPDQIAGRMREQGWTDGILAIRQSMSISRETKREVDSSTSFCAIKVRSISDEDAAKIR